MKQAKNVKKLESVKNNLFSKVIDYHKVTGGDIGTWSLDRFGRPIDKDISM